MLLSACATPTATPAPSATPTNAEAAAKSTIVRAQGRLSVVVEGQGQADTPQSLHAAFQLTYSRVDQKGQLSLFSPLGQTLGELAWSRAGAQVTEGSRSTAYPSVEAMLQAHTGAALPVDALLDWLEGRATAAPGWRVDLTRHADGRINATRNEPQPTVQLRVILEAL